MPRLLDYLHPFFAFLSTIDPTLPAVFAKASFVALVFVTVLLWRKWSPNSWRAYSKLIPVTDADTSWFLVAGQKVLQALPSAALGAIYGALGTGAVLPALKLALWGALAPFIHELAWRYKGNLGDEKDVNGDGSGGGAKITGAAVHGSGSAWVSDDGQSAGGELRVKMTALKRRRREPRLALAWAFCLLCLTGCANWKPIARTADGVAETLCAQFFGEKQKLSLEDAARQFCSTERDLQPWIDSVLAAKRDATPKALALHPVGK